MSLQTDSDNFNNSGTQLTVLILQNPASYTIDGNIYFWDTAGSLLGTQSFSLAAKNTLVLNTATVVPGSSGAITLSNNGRYGDLWRPTPRERRPVRRS